MALESSEASGLVCIPSAIPSPERAAHFELARRLFSESAEERTALSDGYAFRFQPDAFEAIARFVANERRCCPFMDFELVIAREGGPVWLRMTGPAGTRAVIEAELASACAC
jgi:hypothetical protein